MKALSLWGVLLSDASYASCWVLSFNCSQRRILLSARHAPRSNYIIKRLAPGEFHFTMDAVKVVTRQLEVFEKSSVIYLNCVDLAVDIRQSSEMLPFIEYKMLLGHVNFPDELQNRR